MRTAGGLAVVMALWLAGCEAQAYSALHRALPDAVLNQVADALPYTQDVFAPGVFFLAPEPHLPPASKGSDDACEAVGPNAVIDTMVLEEQAALVGTVKGVEPLCEVPACTWDHQTWYIVPDDPKELNAWSGRYGQSWSGMDGTVKVRAPVAMRKLPPVGAHVVTDCAFGLDWAWGGTTCCARSWTAAK